MTPTEIGQYAPLLIVVVLIALMSRRMMRRRRFRAGSMWVGPVIVAASVVLVVASRPMPTPAHAAALALAFVVGLAAGFVRGRLVKIEIDPETAIATQRGTPLGLIFLVILIVLRSTLRIVATQHPELGINLADATDLLLFLALGLVVGYAGILIQAHRRATALHGGVRPEPTAAP